MDAEGAASLAVDEIRDYTRINAEVVRLLDLGRSRISLTGVGGQRLLLSGLSGPWRAVIIVAGNPGPEFAARLDAPHLAIEVRGSAADGLGLGLRAGRIAVEGSVGDAAGLDMAGGEILVRGDAGHRLGLGMTGGTIAAGGDAGRLAGERQRGGTIRARGFGPFRSWGASGGSCTAAEADGGDDASLP